MGALVVAFYTAALVATAFAVASIWMAARFPQAVVNIAHRLTRRRDPRSGARLCWRDGAAQVAFGVATVCGFAVMIYAVSAFVMGWAPSGVREGLAGVSAAVLCIPASGLVWNYAEALLRQK